MNKTVGKILRVIENDPEYKENREQLHQKYNIPNSVNWGTYMFMSAVNNIVTNKLPTDLFEDIEKFKINRPTYLRKRPTRFMLKNKWKSGLNILTNRLADILRTFPTFDIMLKHSKLSLKKVFLK